MSGVLSRAFEKARQNWKQHFTTSGKRSSLSPKEKDSTLAITSVLARRLHQPCLTFIEIETHNNLRLHRHHTQLLRRWRTFEHTHMQQHTQ